MFELPLKSVRIVVVPVSPARPVRYYNRFIVLDRVDLERKVPLLADSLGRSSADDVTE